MIYRFSIFLDRAGEWRFNFVAPNNEIVLQSEGYKSKASAEHAVNLIKQMGPLSPIV